VAVAHDALSEIEKTAGVASSSQTHTPVGTPRGIVVTIARANPGDTVFDFFTSVVYGGVTMTRIVDVHDTSGEHGQACAYFLGSGIPTGAQTWTINYSSAATHDVHAVCASVTAATDTEVLASGSIGVDGTNPQIALTYSGRTGIAYASCYSGLSTVASLTPLGTCTATHDYDLPDGTYVAVACRQTTPGSSDFTIGWTAASDDRAMAAIAVSEVIPAASVRPQPGMMGSHAVLSRKLAWHRRRSGIFVPDRPKLALA
jgi:hypothetical protein